MADEIEVMKKIDTALATLNQDALKRVLKWAWDKHVPESLSPDKSVPLKKNKKQSEKNLAKKGASSKKLSLTIVKDLNLMPKGKKTFADFAKEKQPASHTQKYTVAAYYLEKIIGIKAIGAI